MNEVAFPGLNMQFNINRIAFKWGSIEIYWYAICIVLGILISLIICSKNKDKYEIKYEDFLEIILISLIFGIIRCQNLLYIV